MKMIRFLICALLLLPAFSASSAPPASDSPAPRISLVTADPGPEVFELYGHQAVRVQTPDGDDLIFNFGLFDFDQPGFVYRFVKGQTDYMGGISSTPHFLSAYGQRGSKVTEQVLNLTPAEAERMYSLLLDAVSPENALYRYKYCTNNCATRILDILEQSLGSEPLYPDTDAGLRSYRDVMRRYDSAYPWYAMGVDIALGSGVDSLIGPRERMFVPMQLRKAASATRLADGRPLVKEENILVQGRGDVTQPPTNFFLSPLFWAWLTLLLTLLIVYRAMRFGWHPWRWWAALWFAMTGVAGCLCIFLIFFSEHEATSPNILGWWLNPLWLIPALTIWSRRLRRLTRSVLTMLSVMGLSMLLAWNFGAQHVNMALLLLCVTTMTLSVSYALTGSSTHRHRHHHRHHRCKPRS